MIRYILIFCLLAAPVQARFVEQNTGYNDFSKWTTVLGRTQRQARSPMATRFDALVAKATSVSDQIAYIDAAINRTKYVSDKTQFNKSDYWQTPYEFLGRGGDCEDYAIAKYFALKKLGYKNLRLLVTYDTVLQTPHTVLEVLYRGERIILDNVQDENPDRLTPFYAIAEGKWWRYE